MPQNSENIANVKSVFAKFPWVVSHVATSKITNITGKFKVQEVYMTKWSVQVSQIQKILWFPKSRLTRRHLKYDDSKSQKFEGQIVCVKPQNSENIVKSVIAHMSPPLKFDVIVVIYGTDLKICHSKSKRIHSCRFVMICHSTKDAGENYVSTTSKGNFVKWKFQDLSAIQIFHVIIFVVLKPKKLPFWLF